MYYCVLMYWGIPLILYDSMDPNVTMQKNDHYGYHNVAITKQENDYYVYYNVVTVSKKMIIMFNIMLS